jgi:DNA-binding IclR family transcriptional regulator
MKGPRDSWEEIELSLGSVGKRKILRLLTEDPDKAFTRYALRRTGLKPMDITNDLKTLVAIGWVKEHRYGRRTYQINLENAFVQQFLEFLKKTKYL